jgi:hypothetical protein
MGIGLIF